MRTRSTRDGDAPSSETPRGIGTRLGAPLALGLLVLLLWQLAATVGGVPATFLPAPGAVASRLALEISSGGLLRATALTLGEAALGCLLAAVVSIPLGWLIARVRLMRHAVQPYLAASQAIPAVALAPLLVLWVGYGLRPVVLLCALMVFFPIVVSTVLGLRTLDPEVVEAARIDGAAGWRMLTGIELPLAAPALLSGLRTGFTLSVTGAVVGEMVMGGRGLGTVLSVYSANADTTGLFATIVVLAALAVTIYLVLLALERAVDPLRPGRAERPSRRFHQSPSTGERP